MSEAKPRTLFMQNYNPSSISNITSFYVVDELWYCLLFEKSNMIGLPLCIMIYLYYDALPEFFMKQPDDLIKELRLTF